MRIAEQNYFVYYFGVGSGSLEPLLLASALPESTKIRSNGELVLGPPATNLLHDYTSFSLSSTNLYSRLDLIYIIIQHKYNNMHFTQ